MDELQQAREEINEINKEIVKLFERRMKASKSVAEYKEKNGLPIFDPQREQEVLKNTERLLEEEAFRPYFSDVMQSFMDASKKYQQSLISNDRELYVNLKTGSYAITLTPRCLQDADRYLRLKGRKTLIVTDTGVPEKYVKKIAEKSENPTIFTIQAGEKNKNSDTYLQILNCMLTHGFQRSDCVAAVGGGVVGDLAGFAASTYMRGIDFYNVPTTLLSQVDSSVGGKTAIDFHNTKNTVGSFYQPKAVLVDPEVLKTLPDRELSAGMAEIIKMAATLDRDFFLELEKLLVEEGKTLRELNFESVIRKALTLKKKIVEQDVQEKDLRRVLNFGHTIGHGVEATCGKLLHGECVSIGMVRMCRKREVRERLETLLMRAGLPVFADFSVSDVMEAISHDKKSEKDGICCVLLEDIGQYHLQKLKLKELEERVGGK